MANEIATGDANWLKAGTGHDELTTLLEFERTATSIVDVSPILVPGLLQTSDYARTIMAGELPGEVERLVAMRIGRRDVLTRSKPVDFTAVIAESALRQPMGGRAVMADQLRHIAKVSELDNVTVHVLPHELISWTPAHAGPFILFDFAKTAPIVHHEHLSSSAFLSNLGDIRTHREAAVNLRYVRRADAGDGAVRRLAVPPHPRRVLADTEVTAVFTGHRRRVPLEPGPR